MKVNTALSDPLDDLFIKVAFKNDAFIEYKNFIVFMRNTI